MTRLISKLAENIPSLENGPYGFPAWEDLECISGLPLIATIDDSEIRDQYYLQIFNESEKIDVWFSIYAALRIKDPDLRLSALEPYLW